MRSLPIPESVSSEAQDAFRDIDINLKDLESPIVRKKTNLNHIKEGQVARHYDPDDEVFYSYVKFKGKLYRRAWEEVSDTAPTAYPLQVEHNE